MRKGAICRRITNDGTPIGPYLRFLEQTGENCKVQSLASSPKEGRHPNDGSYSSFPVELLRRHVTEIGVAKIQLTDVVYQRVESNKQTKITHMLTTKWENLWLDWECESLELVQLRSFQFVTKTMMFKIENVDRIKVGRGVDICLYLGERIL